MNERINMMDSNWAESEFTSANLGDKRLNKRLSIIAERFSKSPESAIPQSCEGWAETKAAYRFFQNDSICYQEITKSHSYQTLSRCASFERVLAIQDTTYFNYSHHPKTQGLCSLSRHEGKHKKEIVTSGLIMHSTLMIDTQGLPLGILDQQIYSRPEVSKEKKEKKKRSHNIGIPIEEKDSYRWLEALRNSHQLSSPHLKDVVTICDREADIYDFFKVAQALESQVLVRASHDRRVNKKSVYSEVTGEYLWALMKKQKSIYDMEVSIPEQKDCPKRTAICEVKIATYQLNPPRNHYEIKSKSLPNLTLYAISVTEKEPIEGVEPLDWMLITNIPVQSPEEALEKIKWYTLRWRIETWHKIIKSGLKVEDCRLLTAERLIRYLAVMSIIAWKIHWMTLIARANPEAPCTLFLKEDEWKILKYRFTKERGSSEEIPTIHQAINWIAQLGGFLARKNDNEPGITHLWRGLKKFSNIIEGAEMAKQIYG